MKKTIVSTNWLNKVIAAMMIMAITTAMPAMAGNKKHTNHDKKTTVVVVANDKTTVSTSRQVSHFDKVDKALSHNGSTFVSDSRCKVRHFPWHFKRNMPI